MSGYVDHVNDDDPATVGLRPCVRVTVTYETPSRGSEQVEVTWDDGARLPDADEILRVVGTLLRRSEFDRPPHSRPIPVPAPAPASTHRPAHLPPVSRGPDETVVMRSQ